MKTKILMAAIFFSGLIFAQETKTDSANTKNIEAVTLTKQVFKKESDRFVYDVSNSPVAKGSTTFDILKQTPLLSTTDDKTLKIAGKNNALIFINGRKTNMDADSLNQFLKNTPAENIQKIEVITVPGSEYQVESSDGIINIILKKKMTDGTNGNMRMSSSANKFFSNSASASINYRKDKLGISANLNVSDNIRPQTYDLRNGSNNASTSSIGNIDDPNKNIGGYINADYQLTDNQNLALTWNTWFNKSFDSRTDLFNITKSLDNDNNTVTNYSLTKGRENAKSANNSVNLNYEWKMDELGSKLNLNASYLNYNRKQSSTNQTIASDIFQNVGLISREIKQNQPQIINNFSGMADYVKKFKNDFTVAVGGNYNKTKTDNDTKNDTFDYTYNVDGSIKDINNTPSPNHFVYDENIYLSLIHI